MKMEKVALKSDPALLPCIHVRSCDRCVLDAEKRSSKNGGISSRNI